MSTAIRRVGWMALAALCLASCAGPPVRLYTLGEPPVGKYDSPLPTEANLIEIDRLILPIDLDSEDILLRDGDVLERSPTGRWASRLSLLATDLVSSRLAARIPDALITDHSPDATPDYRVTIHIARLDVAKSGWASMEGDWLISPGNAGLRPVRGRIQMRLAGPTGTDRDIVRLETSLFCKLADTIEVGLRRLNHAAQTSKAQTECCP